MIQLIGCLVDVALVVPWIAFGHEKSGNLLMFTLVVECIALFILGLSGKKFPFRYGKLMRKSIFFCGMACCYFAAYNGYFGTATLFLFVTGLRHAFFADEHKPAKG